MASGLTATTRFVGLLVGIAALGAVLAQVASRSFIPGGVAAGLDAETAAELAKHVTSGDIPGIVGTVPEALMRPSPMDSLRRRCWRPRLPRRWRCSRCFWCGAPRRCRSRVAAPKTWTRVAVAVGRTYKELTGGPENLTQVIFIAVKHGNYFVGSVPPDTH